MSDAKLKHTLKMVGKKVCIVDKNSHLWGKVESAKDWETVVVELQVGGEKREVSIFDIRLTE